MESGRAGTGSEREEERGEEESRSLRVGLWRERREEWQGREKPSLDTSHKSRGGEEGEGREGREGGEGGEERER